MQYIYDLDLASKLAGLNLLNGRGKLALDVGCGKGYGLLALKALSYEVYGFDVNPEAVATCRRLGFNVILHNLEQGIPFNMSFDLITCFDTLEHVRDLRRALKSLLSARWRTLVITVPNLYTEFLRLAYLTLKRRARPSITMGSGLILKDPDHINMYSPPTWLRVFVQYLKEMNVRVKFRLATYMQPVLSSKVFYLRLPLVGSSMMIVALRA